MIARRTPDLNILFDNGWGAPLEKQLEAIRVDQLAAPTVSLSHALDYCGNLADIVATRFLFSCWGSLDSHYLSDRCDRGRNQARHRSWGVTCNSAWKLGADGIIPPATVKVAPFIVSLGR